MKFDNFCQELNELLKDEYYTTKNHEVIVGIKYDVNYSFMYRRDPIDMKPSQIYKNKDDN